MEEAAATAEEVADREARAVAAELLESFLRHEGDGGDGGAGLDRDRLLAVFEAAARVGHHLWPRQIAELLPGRDVLDVGSGNTFYGAVIRALGARSYLGTEPRLNLGKRDFRSRLRKGWVRLDLSLADVVAAVPRLRYARPGKEPTEGRFDLAVMHTVTEHLLDIDAVFADTARALRPGGELWFLHDSFTAWAGHHMAPQAPKHLDPEDPEQALYADWRHLTYEPAPDHPFVTNLNRLRPHELRAATERHFEVIEWRPVPDSRKVAARLTPEVMDRLPGFTREELLTRHVICHARRKG